MTIVAKCRCAGSRRGTDESGEPWFEWPRGSNVIGGARSASGRPRPMAARRCFDARRSMLTRNFWRPRSRATAGTGATIPATRVLRRGGHVRPASRVPPARPRRTREAPQAAGPGGGAEFVTEPRDHHIEDARLCLVNSNRDFRIARATPFRPGIVHCIWAIGRSPARRGVSAQASSQFAIGHDSQVKRLSSVTT